MKTLHANADQLDDSVQDESCHPVHYYCVLVKIQRKTIKFCLNIPIKWINQCHGCQLWLSRSAWPSRSKWCLCSPPKEVYQTSSSPKKQLWHIWKPEVDAGPLLSVLVPLVAIELTHFATGVEWTWWHLELDHHHHPWTNTSSLSSQSPSLRSLSCYHASHQ